MTHVSFLPYPVRHALRNILANRLIHAVSMATITISLLLIGAFLFLYVNVSTWFSQWGESLTMSVYLEDTIDSEAREGIESLLGDLPQAELKRYVSKEDALAEMTEALGSQAGLLEGLSKNPFPASYEIVFREGLQLPGEAEEVKKRLQKISGVGDVEYSEQWAERFRGITYFLRMAGLVIGGLLCVAVLFIVTNTIKLTIYSRRDEIEIMKIVGATDTFVKLPFLIEGLIQGLLGGLVGLAVLFSFYFLFSSQTVQVFGLPIVDIVFLSGEQISFLLGLSVFLGLTGSVIALGRFLET